MSINPETVAHVANLARLELTPDELTRYTDDLDKILGLMAQIDALDLSGLDAGLKTDQAPVLREDLAVREFSREELMQNAPEKEDGFFRVPKILDDAE